MNSVRVLPYQYCLYVYVNSVMGGLVWSNTAGAFVILEDGRLTTAVELNFELVTSYLLTVEAVDGGNPPLIGSTQVEINVTDVNDNAPQFVTPKLTEFDIAEVWENSNYICC